MCDSVNAESLRENRTHNPGSRQEDFSHISQGCGQSCLGAGRTASRVSPKKKGKKVSVRVTGKRSWIVSDLLFGDLNSQVISTWELTYDDREGGTRHSF